MRLSLIATLLAGLAASPAPAAQRALAYFAQHQHPTGGWGHKLVVNSELKRRGGAAASAGVTIPNVPAPIQGEVVTPRTLVETCLVTLAFFESGRNTTSGDGAAELRRAVDLIHNAVDVAGLDRKGFPVTGPIVDKYFYTRGLDQALALETLLPLRDRLVDPELRRKLDFTLDLTLTRIKTAQQANGVWPGEGQFGYLSDALITRGLLIAARHGLAVDAKTLDRARQASLRFYDPAIGESGDASAHASCECALSLNLLYQIDLNARAAAAAAKQRAALPGAAPEQLEDARARAAESQAAHDALALAQKQFFKKLFESNKAAAAAKNKSRPAGNPLDTAPRPRPPANPLDTEASAAEERRRVGLPVPVTPWDAVAYFLLLESLQESTHPQARPVAEGIAAALADKQDREGNWHDRSTRRYDSQDHFLTAWLTRALLVPPPPAPARP
jgi:hypothetical protein